jgi:thiol-disulfide isomerase/thioredoxin
LLRIARSFALIGLASLTACADPALEKRVADLETQVKDINTKMEGMKSAGPGPAVEGPQVDPAREQAASELYRQANEFSEAGKYDEAKGKLGELAAQYGDTRAAKRAGRLSAELAVVGIDAGELTTEKWYTKQTSMNDGKATYVVFWESWCPHCQEEVPKLEATYDKYNSKGLNIVALTKVTRTSSDEKVNEFIKEHKLTFPVGKETGDVSTRFGVQGIPAAAVVKDGKVVWRGHPARVTDAMIEGWING